MSQYKMAAEGKKLDGGMGYDMVAKDGENTDSGMDYSMGAGETSEGSGMSYSMSAGSVDKGSGMKYTEGNKKGRIEEDGYTQGGK